jgi:hypothetical protein
VQLKAIESLGRLRDAESVATAAGDCRDQENVWLGASPGTAHRGCAVTVEDRSALQRADSVGQRIEPAELAIAPLDMAPACPWVRQRRYERHDPVKDRVGDDWQFVGQVKIMIRELSLGGGMGTKEDNLRIGSEADLEISLGMRSKIKAHVLLRRARVNEVGFEIVSMLIWKAATSCGACWWRL